MILHDLAVTCAMLYKLARNTASKLNDEYKHEILKKRLRGAHGRHETAVEKFQLREIN